MNNSVLLAVAMCAASVRLFGGSVITTNIPANVAILNINGHDDGAAGYNGDLSLWYHPFSQDNTIPTYQFQPGTYSFTITDPADATQLFPGLTTAQTNLIYTAWTYNTPWIEDYMAFDSSAMTNSSIPQLFDGAPDAASFGDPQSAYNHAVTNGWANKIRTGLLGRNGTNYETSYTFTNTETLVFIIPDYDVNDNNGGVSVIIRQITLAPLLSIISLSGNVTLEWPTNAGGFTLAQSTNMSPATWHDVGTLPGVIGTNNSVTLPMAQAASSFFRLHNP